MDNPLKLRMAKKDLARVKTAIRARQLAGAAGKPSEKAAAPAAKAEGEGRAASSGEKES